MIIDQSSLTSISSSSDDLDIDTCKLLQQEELHTLESGTVSKCVSIRQPNDHLRLEVPIELGRSCVVEIVSTVSAREREVLSLSILPPIILHLELPPTYPAHSPPTIVSARATYSWLPDNSTLQDFLNKIWKPGDSVLYLWIEKIRSGEFMRDLKMFSGASNSLEIGHSDPSLIALLLSAYDLSSQSARFSTNSYSCGICFEILKGSKCIRLKCSHVFCRSCLKAFWGMCISEGCINRVGCPDPKCVQERRQALEEDVVRVVTESDLRRWKWLKNKQEVARDRNFLKCPVPTCQNLVSKPESVDPLSVWHRFRQCSNCSYSFCSFCRHAWHGPLTVCPLRFTDTKYSDSLARKSTKRAKTVTNNLL